MLQPRILILASALAISAMATVNAQEIRLGGGYSGSIVDSKASDNVKGRAGYQYGIDVLIGNRFFVKPGIYMQVRNLDYTTQGLGSDGKPNGINTESRIASKALRIPVMAGFRLLDNDNTTDFNLYLTGGPTALIDLSTDVGDNSLSFSTRGTQWYIGFGLGAEYRFLFVDAGYDVAMSNAFTGEGINTNPKVNNVYVTAGLRFVLNK
ncbi:MAG: outer membrane beta-barrel protein [Flavobacteriales bacterium]